jgi:hypothetical protein
MMRRRAIDDGDRDTDVDDAVVVDEVDEVVVDVEEDVRRLRKSSMSWNPRYFLEKESEPNRLSSTSVNQKRLHFAVARSMAPLPLLPFADEVAAPLRLLLRFDSEASVSLLLLSVAGSVAMSSVSSSDKRTAKRFHRACTRGCTYDDSANGVANLGKLVDDSKSWMNSGNSLRLSLARYFTARCIRSVIGSLVSCI